MDCVNSQSIIARRACPTDSPDQLLPDNAQAREAKVCGLGNIRAMAVADNTIDLGDQASFTGLRALGRGPLIQYTWIYEHPIDLDGLRRLHRNLGSGGLLGRRIERSPLPFGRHRWVRSTGPLG